MILGLSCFSIFAKTEKVPNCYGNENWATQSALTSMVNAGLIKNSDSEETVKTELLRSEKVGYFKYEKKGKEYPLYSLTQKITLQTKEGNKFEAITFSQATEVECSMSGVDVVVTYPEPKFLSSKIEK